MAVTVHIDTAEGGKSEGGNGGRIECRDATFCLFRVITAAARCVMCSTPSGCLAGDRFMRVAHSLRSLAGLVVSMAHARVLLGIGSAGINRPRQTFSIERLSRVINKRKAKKEGERERERERGSGKLIARLVTYDRRLCLFSKKIHSARR